MFVSARVVKPSGGTMRYLELLALIAAIISGSLAQSNPTERRCTGGVCVPFYLCRNGLVIEDGDGLIDKRFADSECPDDYVCCKVQEFECRGQCLPAYQCPSDGRKDLIDLRSFDDKCPGSLVCCYEPPVESTPCTCVAFYQCLDSTVDTGAIDLVDLRFSDEKCPGDEVCCVNPRTQDNTIVVESSCKGKCVPFEFCPNRTNSAGTVDLRAFDDCPNDQVCCESLPGTSIEVTAVCDGKCVPFNQCPGGVLNTGGLDLIDLRRSESVCSADQVCCSTTESSSNSVITKPMVTESSSCNGTCVPFYQCPMGKPNTGGKNLLDLRGLDDCPNDLVCCDSSSEILPKCDGECVPFYQCPAGSPNTDGKDLLNLRRDYGACPRDLVCCKGSPKEPESACKGKCVPFYQCPNGNANTGGEDLLNLRSFDVCPRDLVCCETSNEMVSEVPPSCDGLCVPFYQCPAGSPNIGGKDLLNLRSDDRTCPGDSVCCKKSQNVTTGPSPNSCKGKCVPSYQCPQGQKNTGGLGLINLRSLDDCPNNLVCCETSSIAVSNKPPTICDGKCVPASQCSEGLSSTNGQNLIDLRRFDDSCPGGQVCCKEPIQTPKLSCKGKCVPLFQCPLGKRNIGGKDLLNLRSIGDCPKDLVCCEATPTEVSIKPPTICDGRCVPAYQCSVESSIPNNQNIIDLRNLDDSCPGEQVCCKEPVKTEKPFCKGSCVPLNQCPQGQQNTGGLGLLNLRSLGDCPNDLVCCEITPTEVSIEPPAICDGKCVPTDQCPVSLFSKDRQNVLDLRRYDDSCPGDQVCCKESAKTPKSSCKGKCVPIYQCPEGQPNTGGGNLLNLRRIHDCPKDLICCENAPESTKICQGQCVPSSQCMSATSGVEDLLDLRMSNDICPKNLVCCERKEIFHMNPHRAMWMQWINDINGMQVIGGQPVKYDECSLQIDLNRPFADQREVPWLVTVWSKVQYLGQVRDDYHCVGTVIRSDVVLIPADCVPNVSASKLYIRTGNYNLKETDGVKELKVTNINVHPDFDFTNDHSNVALLSLQSAVASPSTACLAKHDEQLSGQNCLLVGWTSLDLLDNDVALPRKHRLNLTGSPGCRSDSLCIAGNTQSTRNCDSFHGSPLLCPGKSGQQWRVAGLVTRGSAKCDVNAVPENLIKVSSLQAWISEQLAPSFVNIPAVPEPSRKYLPVF